MLNTLCTFSDLLGHQSDVKIVQEEEDVFITSVALYRSDTPIAEFEVTADDINATNKSYNAYRKAERKAKQVRIKLPYAGMEFVDNTAQELYTRLIELHTIGYNIPVFAIEKVQSLIKPTRKRRRK